MNPIREEVLGMVNIESLACGTSVLTKKQAMKSMLMTLMRWKSKSLRFVLTMSFQCMTVLNVLIHLIRLQNSMNMLDCIQYKVDIWINIIK